MTDDRGTAEGAPDDDRLLGPERQAFVEEFALMLNDGAGMPLTDARERSSDARTPRTRAPRSRLCSRRDDCIHSASFEATSTLAELTSLRSKSWSA